MIEVIATGPLATIQDLGRPGYAHLGVSRSGAFDRAALRLANRLVGNAETAAGIELLAGGFAFRLTAAATVALTGAHCGGDLRWGQATTLPSGVVVTISQPAAGLRSYLAVRGGIEATAPLGSRSTDTLSGIGPDPLQIGDVVPVGAGTPSEVDGSLAVAVAPRPLRVVPGPRTSWFDPDCLGALLTASWTVQPDSDRIGVRLQGPALRRRRDGELPSEPTIAGALQVPPDGQPILLGPDAPVTGGYPVIAVVRDDDLDLAAQLRPGQSVRFS